MTKPSGDASFGFKDRYVPVRLPATLLFTSNTRWKRLRCRMWKVFR